jgi:hypothetical protein
MEDNFLRAIRRFQEDNERQNLHLHEALRSLDLGHSDTIRRLLDVASTASVPPYLDQALRSWDRLGASTLAHERLLRERLDAFRIPAEKLSTLGLAFHDAIQRVTQLEPSMPASTLLRLQEIERMGDVLKTLDKSFALPNILNQSELLKIASAIKTPWAEATAPSRSFAALSALQSLGETLRLPVFGAEESSAIRRALGDWRGISLPETIFADWQTRTEFYREHGFNTDLTALSEPAFTESMRLTGIWQPEFFSPVLPAFEHEHPQEDVVDVRGAVRQRMVEAYDALFVLECTVRSFLVGIMTARHGNAWAKQRVPGPTLTAWRRKRDEEAKKGLPRRTLIEYADFTDYADIIIRGDNWDQGFGEIFTNKDDVKVSFQRLSALRNCTMHSRELSKDDYILLLAETRRIHRAISATTPELQVKGEEE